MSQSPQHPPPSSTPETYDWVQDLPDGAVSVESQKSCLILKASSALQERFEILLAKKKSTALSSEEQREYEAICGLDTALSWLNRLARERHPR